uniref:X8 domain-containing protein n=1 Tax=Oryza punctata TaxID=4537 RepID=A0A0E0MGJ7_ORYPU
MAAAAWRCVAAVVGVVITAATVVDGLGVNWGTMATHRLPPKVMARLLKDNGFKKVKIFDADATTMSGLAGTGIETMIAVPNDMLAAVGDYGRAREWVKENVTRYSFDGGVNIRYVAVGNEPFLKAYNGEFDRVTVPALRNIQRALNEAGYGKQIKATVPVNADVYDSPPSNPVPSAGKFRDDVAGTMTDMVRFLNRSGAPLTVNIYPFLSLYGNDNFPLDYAFFDGGPPPRPVVDNGINYTNVFDANFDTPVPYAQRFYSGLLKRLAARRGTPLRPRTHIEVYLFGLMDEDTKSVAPGNFERHWGIFTFDGRPKFPLDLRGDGRPAMPVPAKGVKYLPRRWCVLNPNVTDDDAGRLADNVGYACSHSDCTALGYGCSCGALDARGNASYAFNVYYQAQGQAEAACDFQGLAVVTDDDRDVAQGACNFSVQVAAAVACTAAVVAALLVLV